MRRIPVVAAWCALVGAGTQLLSGAPAEEVRERKAGGRVDVAVATRPGGRLADRASCSSLCLLKQGTEEALKAIGEIGYRWVDLSALKWAPHVSVENLLQDFDKESARVEAALKAANLRISNFTFDSFDGRPMEEYKREMEALARFGARHKARLINIMAPSNKMGREEAAAKLRELVALTKKHGLILTIETHVGQITERPADALWLCRQVPGLGLTLDPSHYYAGPHQGKPFDELYPYVEGTGFRAGGMTWDTIESPWGTGPIDFEKIVRDLERAGYKGFYETEYLQDFKGKVPVDAVEESRKFLEWMKRIEDRR